jgi:hypothetical protein
VKYSCTCKVRHTMYMDNSNQGDNRLQIERELRQSLIKGVCIAKFTKAGISDPAATLQNRQNLIHDTVLLVLLGRHRYAEQVLARIDADNLINHPTF